jgi:hypothetical protein
MKEQKYDPSKITVKSISTSDSASLPLPHSRDSVETRKHDSLTIEPRIELKATQSNPLRITSVSTKNQHSHYISHFHPNEDALALRMDVTASEELLETEGSSFSALFQIVNVLTNTVVVNKMHPPQRFQWGPHFFVSEGNNWGPNYTTPNDWGLWKPEYWQDGGSIFGARFIIKAYAELTDGLHPLNTFDVSEMHWFRVEYGIPY